MSAEFVPPAWEQLFEGYRMLDARSALVSETRPRQAESLPGVRPQQKRPIVLLGLPNTGTDWVVDLLLRQNPHLRYFREFFNPICNPTYENDLNCAFGSEMVDNYALIAKTHCPYDAVYQRTWAKENYNFTKENFSAFKLAWFLGKFDCFVLYRRAELTLPGSRLQVKTWYDAMYCSLLRNRWTLEPDVRALVDFAVAEADTIAKRQVAAFVIYYYKLLKDARRRHVPILNFNLLMQGSYEELLPPLCGLPAVADAEKLAYDICQERRLSSKDFAALQAEDFFARLTELARGYGGDAVAVLAPWRQGETSFEEMAASEPPPVPVAGRV
jgi:hypothetical protein